MKLIIKIAVLVLLSSALKCNKQLFEILENEETENKQENTKIKSLFENSKELNHKNGEAVNFRMKSLDSKDKSTSNTNSNTNNSSLKEDKNLIKNDVNNIVKGKIDELNISKENKLNNSVFSKNSNDSKEVKSNNSNFSNKLNEKISETNENVVKNTTKISLFSDKSDTLLNENSPENKENENNFDADEDQDEEIKKIINNQMLTNREKELQTLLEKEKKLRKKESVTYKKKQTEQIKKIADIESKIESLLSQNTQLKEFIGKKVKKDKKKAIKHKKEEKNIISFVETVSKKVKQVNSSISESNNKLEEELKAKEENIREDINAQTASYHKLLKKLELTMKEVSKLKSELKSAQNNDLAIYKNLKVEDSIIVNGKSNLNSIHADSILLSDEKGDEVKLSGKGIYLSPKSELVVSNVRIPSLELARVTEYVRELTLKCGGNLENCFIKPESTLNKELLESVSNIRRKIK